MHRLKNNLKISQGRGFQACPGFVILCQGCAITGIYLLPVSTITTFSPCIHSIGESQCAEKSCCLFVYKRDYSVFIFDGQLLYGYKSSPHFKWVTFIYVQNCLQHDFWTLTNKVILVSMWATAWPASQCEQNTEKESTSSNDGMQK